MRWYLLDKERKKAEKIDDLRKEIEYIWIVLNKRKSLPCDCVGVLGDNIWGYSYDWGDVPYLYYRIRDCTYYNR